MLVLSFCHIALLLYDETWQQRLARAAVGKLHTFLVIMMMEFAEAGSTTYCSLCQPAVVTPCFFLLILLFAKACDTAVRTVPDLFPCL